MTALATTSSPRLAERGSARIRTLAAAMVLVLLGQLLLGMANTFWLEVPESGPAWNAAQPASLVTAHMTLGTALVVLAIWIGWIAVRTRDRVWITASVIGLVGIVLGFAGGTAFMGDPSSDVSSYVMAVGCALAIAAYALGLAALPATTPQRT
jgi:hypothetical protein